MSTARSPTCGTVPYALPTSAPVPERTDHLDGRVVHPRLRGRHLVGGCHDANEDGVPWASARSTSCRGSVAPSVIAMLRRRSPALVTASGARQTFEARRVMASPSVRRSRPGPADPRARPELRRARARPPPADAQRHRSWRPARRPVSHGSRSSGIDPSKHALRGGEGERHPRTRNTFESAGIERWRAPAPREVPGCRGCVGRRRKSARYAYVTARA